MINKMKWGILGCANIAEKQFLPALLDCSDSVLHATASRDLEKGGDWAKKWGAKRAYGSYDELLADSKVEAVYIPLPNHLHHEWTIKALEAGKHVLCEKPMAVTSEECLGMLDVAKREKLFFMEAFMYRFHPQIEQTLCWIKEGRIGEVRLVRGSFSFPLKSKGNIRLQDLPGGGSLWDVGCYPIHFTNLIFGGPPKNVMALGVFQTVDVSMTGLLEYGSNQQAVFDCSFNMDHSSGIEIVGTKGKIFISQPWRPDRQIVSISLRIGNKREEVFFPISNPYQLEIEHFQACVQEGVESLLPGYLGLDVVSTIEACYQSARENRQIKVQRQSVM